jgi:hypothetical protein
MRRSRMLAVSAVAAVALAAALGPAAAQGGPIDPGVYTATVVHPMAPFHTPTINVNTVNLENIGTTLEPLTAAQLLEVRQRCSTVVANTDRYSEAARNFCAAVFAWVAVNRPDAPDTDAALAAMAP